MPLRFKKRGPQGQLVVLSARTVKKDRKVYRVGEVWGTESERELTRRCSIEPIVRVPEGVVV